MTDATSGPGTPDNPLPAAGGALLPHDECDKFSLRDYRELTERLLRT